MATNSVVAGEAREPVTLELDPEMEFLASKQETGNEWELFKENVRPLKRGRNVGLLNHALKSYTHSHVKKSLLLHRRRLIEAIDDYKGDDPLQPWIECIKWIQEAFPPGGDCSGLVVIYEQCVRTFWHEDRYKDALRYLKVWLEYAENCVDAEVVFNFLEANKIGVTHASFYISYALHMEHEHKPKSANEIFNRGLSVNAQPIDNLKAAYKKFLTRSMRQMKATDEDDAENQLPARSFGTVLAKESRNQIPGSSDIFRKKMKPDRAHRTSAFSIYNENSSASVLGHHSQASKVDVKPWHSLGARAERNKENNAIPSKWTSNKIPQRPGPRIVRPPPGPRIEIFVDEECSEQNKVDNDGEKSPVLQLRRGDSKDLKKESELLRENPLRNFPKSSLPR